MISEDASEGAVKHDDVKSAARLLDARWPFGPLFFLTQLRAFVRDRCPDPAEGLPVVHLHLADGETLDICHIIGVAPSWLVLAVNEPEGPTGAPTMRTELVPYDMVHRITIRTERVGGHHAGFDLGRRPDLVPAPASPKAKTPEEALAATSGLRPKAADTGGSTQNVGDTKRASNRERRK